MLGFCFMSPISSSVIGGRCFENSWTAFIISLVDTIMFPFWKRCFLILGRIYGLFSAPEGFHKTPPALFASFFHVDFFEIETI